MRVLGKQLNKPTPQHQRTHSGNKEGNEHVLSSIISSVADVCSGHAGCVSKELTGNYSLWQSVRKADSGSNPASTLADLCDLRQVP